MFNIAILSSSVRIDRKSHRVALFFKNFIESRELGSVNLIDLHAYQFPVFEERLSRMKDPSAQVLQFASSIREADGVIIVTPEYNGGYPAALKNVIDLLYTEWKRKPVSIASVSDGPFGAGQVNTSLLFSLWKIGAWVTPALFQVPKVNEAYDEAGIPADPAGSEKRAQGYLNELIWSMEAASRMKS